MGKITHIELVELGTLLGYSYLEKGLCAGLMGMWEQAIFAQQDELFYERLAFISNYKNKLSELVDAIRKAQQKQNENNNLNKDDVRKLLDIDPFYCGLKLYLNPRDRNYFPRYVNQNDLGEIFSLVKPILLEEKKEEVLLDKDYSFTRESLTRFLEDLSQLLSQTQSPTPIRLTSSKHAIGLKYNSQEKLWTYLDVNDFERFPEEKKYYRKLDTQTLVKSIFTSFNPRAALSPHVVFNTKLLAIDAEEKLKKDLEELDSKYPLNAMLIQYSDDTNAKLFYLACQQGHFKTVKELLSKFDYKDYINQADNTGFTPFYIACQQGHTDIVKALLASPQFKGINAVDIKNHHTPLIVACFNQKDTNAKNELFQILLREGARLSHKNKAGKTALDIAFSTNNQAAIRELLQWAMNKNFPLPTIMSLETREKAKNWVSQNPLEELVNRAVCNYLNEENGRISESEYLLFYTGIKLEEALGKRKRKETEKPRIVKSFNATNNM